MLYRILLILLLCFSSAVSAKNINDTESFTIFGRKLVGEELRLFVNLYAAVDTAGRRTALWEANGSEAYKVPDGYQLRLFAVRQKSGGTASHGQLVGYANAPLGVNDTAAAADPVYMFGASATGATSTEALTWMASSSQSQFESLMPINFVVPSASYPFIQASAASQGDYFYGFLELTTVSL